MLRTLGIAGAWLLIGFGFGLLLRAILILGRPNRERENNDY